ncbi:hypothetical protein AB0C38_16865 [Amycolatopsis sp. NPDC048633]|uniref:hypothetical protein n=1 Tax=Amycolatopsis sp. NPDC048633 TaxID=3157095 RepID=UPI0033E180F2
MEVLQIIQVGVLGPSLFFIGYQVLLQRQQVRNQVAVQRYKLYHLLAQQYMNLLLRADLDPELNCIWEPLEDDRRKTLDQAQSLRTWGAWHAMNPTEKRCYRFVRSALETLEQTHQLNQKNWIDRETWIKWQGWIDIWRGARFFDYVFEDVEPRLISTFVLVLKTAGEPAAENHPGEG